MAKKNSLEEIIDIERMRDQLSKNGKMNLLGELYNAKIPQLVNRNNSRYWNERLRFSGMVGEMDQDKISIVSRLINRKKSRILNIGFGAGSLERRFIHSKNINWYGIEISALAVKHAAKTYRGKFYRGSMLHIPFPDRFFDTCVCLEVLEHVSPRNAIKALLEVKRVLKKGGLFILSVPLNEDLASMEKTQQNVSAHVRQYTDNIVRGELELVGFKTLFTQYFFAFANFYKLKRFLQKYILRNRWSPNNFLVIAKSG